MRLCTVICYVSVRSHFGFKPRAGTLLPYMGKRGADKAPAGDKKARRASASQLGPSKQAATQAVREAGEGDEEKIETTKGRRQFGRRNSGNHREGDPDEVRPHPQRGAGNEKVRWLFDPRLDQGRQGCPGQRAAIRSEVLGLLAERGRRACGRLGLCSTRSQGPQGNAKLVEKCTLCI